MTENDYEMEIESLEAWVQALLNDKAALQREIDKSDRENDAMRQQMHCPRCSQDLSIWEA